MHTIYDVEAFLKRVTKDRPLAELGRLNLRHLVSTLRTLEAEESEPLRNEAKGLETLSALSLRSIKASADFGIDYRALVPFLPHEERALRLDTSAFRYGHTTFRSCGRCTHAGSWKDRKVSCSFLEEEEKQHVSPTSRCRLTEESIRAARERLRREAAESVANKRRRREEVRARIKSCQTAAKVAPELPLLPSFRPKGHYGFGDRVLVFATAPSFGKLQNACWLPAIVLRGGEEVAIALDKEWLPRGAYPDDDLVRRSWARRLWKVQRRSPFILSCAELDVLGSLGPEHSLCSEWVRLTGGWGLQDYAQRHAYYTTRPSEFITYLQSPTVMPGVAIDARLMSVAEAMAILGLVTMPESADDIVSAYRSWLVAQGHRTDAERSLVERARSTLLVRMYGQEEVGG